MFVNGFLANKLECLSLKSLNTLLWYLQVRLGAIHRGDHQKGAPGAPNSQILGMAKRLGGENILSYGKIP